MSAGKELGLRAGAALVAMLIAAPVLGGLLPDVAFHRIMTRTFLVTLVLALVVGRSPIGMWPEKLRAMGAGGPDRLRRFGLGVAVSLILVTLVLVASWLLGGREPAPPHRLDFFSDVSRALLSAIGVSFFEEIVCRGYLKDAIGGIASAAIYSAVHFMRPLVTTAASGAGGYDPLLAVQRLPELWEAWSDPRTATLGFLSLFVFGLALNRMRERTGTLYLGIGVHAGLVLALGVYRRLLTGDATDPWIHGGPRLHDGVLGIVMLLVFLVMAYRAPLPRRFETPGPS